MRHEINRHLTLYGTRKEIEQSLRYLKNEVAACIGINHANEGEARLMIQQMIEQKLVTAEVLLDGNTVYDKTKILRNISSMVRHDNMSLMTDYTYHFLTNCGSIAHFSKAGWISTYPTVDSLRRFFLKNEYGQRVLNSQPPWATDRIAILQEIERILNL